jgi:hypothetical protein
VAWKYGVSGLCLEDSAGVLGVMEMDVALGIFVFGLYDVS